MDALSAKSTRTSRGESAVTVATSLRSIWMAGEPFSFSVVKVKTTSSAVTGWPSAKVAPSRRVKITQERSAGYSIFSARRP